MTLSVLSRPTAASCLNLLETLGSGFPDAAMQMTDAPIHATSATQMDDGSAQWKRGVAGASVSNLLALPLAQVDAVLLGDSAAFNAEELVAQTVRLDGRMHDFDTKATTVEPRTALSALADLDVGAMEFGVSSFDEFSDVDVDAIIAELHTSGAIDDQVGASLQPGAVPSPTIVIDDSPPEVAAASSAEVNGVLGFITRSLPNELTPQIAVAIANTQICDKRAMMAEMLDDTVGLSTEDQLRARIAGNPLKLQLLDSLHSRKASNAKISDEAMMVFTLAVDKARSACPYYKTRALAFELLTGYGKNWWTTTGRKLKAQLLARDS